MPGQKPGVVQSIDSHMRPRHRQSYSRDSITAKLLPKSCPGRAKNTEQRQHCRISCIRCHERKSQLSTSAWRWCEVYYKRARGGDSYIGEDLLDVTTAPASKQQVWHRCILNPYSRRISIAYPPCQQHLCQGNPCAGTLDMVLSSIQVKCMHETSSCLQQTANSVRPYSHHITPEYTYGPCSHMPIQAWSPALCFCRHIAM